MIYEMDKRATGGIRGAAQSSARARIVVAIFRIATLTAMIILSKPWWAVPLFFCWIVMIIAIVKLITDGEL